jgi:hypothetical protein
MTTNYNKNILNSNASYQKDNILSNKYLLGSKTTNVLKKDYTLNYSDYEKLKINEQYNKLYSNIYDKNKMDITLDENQKVYNLSFNLLINNAIKSYIQIINELSLFFSKEQPDKSLNKLFYIFTKDENILYIGLFILILSFLFWLIDVTK